MKKHYQLLEWDSNHFGILVAKICDTNLSQRALKNILTEIKGKPVKLVYWASDKKLNSKVIKNLHGNLVDIKTTLWIDFSAQNEVNDTCISVVEPYIDSMSTTDLENLAIQCGEHSRYANDLNIQRREYIALYEIWINKCLKKQMAFEVLVIKDGCKIVGMITLDDKHGRGNIGLIAVDIHYRGRRYSEKLVLAGQKLFCEKGYKYGQVVTQSKNIAACQLYQKCGYVVDKKEYFYHFWL